MTAAAPSPSTLQALRSTNPEWSAWLALLEESWLALADPAWRRAVPDAPGASAESTPLLTGVTVTVQGRTLDRFVERFLRVAAGSGPAAGLAGVAKQTDAADLVEAAVCRDGARLDAIASRAGAEALALRAVAPLLAMPLLQACAAAWTEHVAAAWDRGYCPVCGAWPALAEARGLEGRRRLRCAACGSDWGAAWLRCPFCGESDHKRLGALMSEATGHTRKVDVCHACRGYVKTATVLAARPPAEVALADLETVDLDVAAMEHGFARPVEPGYALGLTVVPRTAARGFLGLFRVGS